jgi:hypothetical protein
VARGLAGTGANEGQQLYTADNMNQHAAADAAQSAAPDVLHKEVPDSAADPSAMAILMMPTAPLSVLTTAAAEAHLPLGEDSF